MTNASVIMTFTGFEEELVGNSENKIAQRKNEPLVASCLANPHFSENSLLLSDWSFCFKDMFNRHAM